MAEGTAPAGEVNQISPIEGDCMAITPVTLLFSEDEILIYSNDFRKELKKIKKILNVAAKTDARRFVFLAESFTELANKILAERNWKFS